MVAYTIQEIERAIPYHINYNGGTTGQYLRIMDRLAFGYCGAPAQKISVLLNEYYKAVGVNNLDEAIDRLKTIKGEDYVTFKQ